MIEKQPKTSVVVRAVRVNPDTGEVEHLLNKRLREPYFGKVGHITGKVRFGEKIEEAAARELMEETGLKAGRVEIEGIYRKMRHREDGSFVQDVFFYCSFVKDLSGEMIKRTEYQENFWLSETEYKRRYDIDLYDDFEWHNDVECRSFGFIENVDQAEDAF
ncbi:NUDIX domain-containing protein [Candidatus Dojkabacteria bacterium]|nr:NUDIX domain-containing protein [Candidatus Dojkabacteria bacterium]